MVCTVFGFVSEIWDLRRLNVTNQHDWRPDPTFSIPTQGLNLSDSHPTSSHFWELSCHRSQLLNGHRTIAESQWNRHVRCSFSKNNVNIQGCPQKKQSTCIRLCLPCCILGVNFQISSARSCIKCWQACRKSRKLRPQAVTQSKDDLPDGCDEIQMQDKTFDQTPKDETGIYEESGMLSAGNRIAFVHKNQQEGCQGKLEMESNRKSMLFHDNTGVQKTRNHGKVHKAQRLYETNLLAPNDVELQNLLSTIGPVSSLKYCNAVLKSLEKENDDKTLQLFHWMRQNGKVKENVRAYNIAFRVLSRRQDWSAVEKLLEEMSTVSCCELNSQIFNTLIYSCSKGGLVKWGAKWFRRMVDEGILPTEATYGMLMSLYQKAGNLHEAEITFENMKSSTVNCCRAYSAMITIYTRLGFHEKAEEVIDLMNQKQVIPNQENWLVQLNAYSQQGKLHKAERVMQLMQKSGISPNIIAFNSLITGYGKAGLLECAIHSFQDLLSAGLKPDEATYRSMVEGCGKIGNLKEAMWYYNEMKSNGFRPSSLNFKTIINLQAKFKDEEGIVQILIDVRKMGCQYASIIPILVKAYEKANRLDKVPFILKTSFHERGLLDETSCAILVLAYAHNGMLAEALDILQEIPDSVTALRDGLYHVLICSCKETGNYEDATQVFSKMPKGHVDPNLQITCTMIDIYSRLGLFAEAQNLFLQLKASHTKLDMVTFSVVVKMYLNAGLPNDAAQVLEMMETQNDIQPDSCLFHYMLRVYHKCNLLDKAAKVYYRILQAKLKWDGAMYNCIINCCGQALPIDEVSRIFDDMLRLGFVPNTITFNVMIDLYGKAGLLTKAHDVLRLARKQGLCDTISYSTMISAYGKQKDCTGMETTLQEMRHGGFVVSLEAYNSMLDAYGKAEQRKKFGDVLERMIRAGCYFDLITYNILINIYGKMGLMDELTNVLMRIKQEGLQPDVWTYNTLIGAYGVVGMTDDAVRVVKEMQDAGIHPDRVTYLNLIAAFKKSNNVLEVVRWSLWMKRLGWQVKGFSKN